MPKLSPKVMAERREAIVDAAASAFADGAFESPSTAEIARRADISEGLIYRYFPNKHALLLTVLRRFSDEMIDGLEERVFAAEGFGQRLNLLVNHYLAGLVANPAFSRLYMAEVRAGDEGSVSARMLTERPRLIWQRIMSEGLAAGEVRPDAGHRLTREIIWAVIERAAALHHEGVLRAPLEETARRVADLLASGISAPAK